MIDAAAVSSVVRPEGRNRGSAAKEARYGGSRSQLLIKSESTTEKLHRFNSSCAQARTSDERSAGCGGSAVAGRWAADRQHVAVSTGRDRRRDADTVLDAGRQVQRGGGGHQCGLGREVMADQAVVVIVPGTVVVVLIPVARLRMPVIAGGVRMVVMAAAVCVAVRMTGCLFRRVRMTVPGILDGMHPSVAEQRHAAVNGEQAPANQVVDAGIHRSPPPRVCVSVHLRGQSILFDHYAGGNPDSGAIRPNVSFRGLCRASKHRAVIGKQETTRPLIKPDSQGSQPVYHTSLASVSAD